MPQPQAGIPSVSLVFLNRLRKHNNREWFNSNKDAFIQAQGSIESFADSLLALLNTHALIETPSGKKSLHRIYRDTRFAKDKIPYNTYWATALKGQHNSAGAAIIFTLNRAKALLPAAFRARLPQI